ncbi:MAG: A/G-specific adenine glycosylase [Alphaproteobacteria bacterium]|nr:A/G-specific adenine glycosylase [Alphaproteobacteria bacterium]
MTNAQRTEKPAPGAPSRIVKRLLGWYDRHRRVLPWRAPAGGRADPYRVWLSEIMLQQTTVPTVGRRFQRFLERWPTVDALAAASLDEVLHEWQGLGYYARARNLHACAGTVVREHGGAFPGDEAALRVLPGVGDYTAAAIAAIAFDRKATVVDGNVERVVARLFAIETPLPAAKRAIRAAAATLTPRARPGDFAQAMMDLGAAVCTPRRPRCLACPIAGSCRARAQGAAEELPRRAARAERPTRRGVAFWMERPDGAVLLRRRPERGLLGGMMELPSTEWRDAAWDDAEARAEAPIPARLVTLPGTVRHGFTHFALELTVLLGRVRAGEPAPAGALWCPIDRLGEHALPTAMKKLVRHALSARDALPRGRLRAQAAR